MCFTLTAHLISDLATLPMLSGTPRGRDLGSPACTGSPSAERSTQDAEQVHFPTNEGKSMSVRGSVTGYPGSRGRWSRCVYMCV